MFIDKTKLNNPKNVLTSYRFLLTLTSSTTNQKQIQTSG